MSVWVTLRGNEKGDKWGVRSEGPVLPSIHQQMQVQCKAIAVCQGWKTLKKLSIDFVCILGCLCQIWIVTKGYLVFEVATKVYIYFPRSMNSPAVSVCSTYSDLVDLSLAGRKYRTLAKLKHPLSQKEKATLQSDLTIGDIFHLTPQPVVRSRGHLLTRCRLRSSNNYSLALLASERCGQLFAVERFVSQESMCYMFKLAPQTLSPLEMVHDVNRLSQSLSHNGLFYKLYLSASESFLHWTSKMRVVAHTPESLPFMSYSLSPQILRHTGKGSKLQFNKVILTFSIVQVHLLPPPYVTNCDQRNMKNKCLNQCIHKLTVRQLGKLPFSVIIREADLASGSFEGKSRVVSTLDMEDRAINSLIENITSLCDNRCAQRNCYLDYTLTHPIQFKSLKRQLVVVEVGSMSQPFVRIDTLPSFQLNDYLLMILSLCGFWLGLGVKDTLILLAAVAVRIVRIGNKVTKNNSSAMVKGKVGSCTVFCVQTRSLALSRLKVLFQRATKSGLERGGQLPN